MTEKKVEAFVLEKKLGWNNEAHLLLLSREKGLFYATAEGVLKSGAKLSAWTEPPTLILANLIFREEKKGFGKIINLSPIEYFENVKQSYENLSWYFFCVFLIKNFLIEKTPDQFYFLLFKELLLKSPAFESPENRDFGFIYFLTKILKKEGLMPNWENCSICQTEFQKEDVYFLPFAEEGFFCQKCLLSQKTIPKKNFFKYKLNFLKMLPPENRFDSPEGVMRIGQPERELLVFSSNCSEISSVFSDFNSSFKINNQVHKKVRNLLLLFLETVL